MILALTALNLLGWGIFGVLALVFLISLLFFEEGRMLLVVFCILGLIGFAMWCVLQPDNTPKKPQAEITQTNQLNY